MEEVEEAFEVFVHHVSEDVFEHLGFSDIEEDVYTDHGIPDCCGEVFKEAFKSFGDTEAF